MGRRTLLVIASVLVAAAGTAMIWLYVQGADSRARGKWQNLVTVLVATDVIPVGADATALEAVTEPEQVPADFFTRDDPPVTSLKALKQRTTKLPVLKGQFLVSGQFDEHNIPTGVGKKGMVVSIMMQDPNRVASLLRPGSRVAVFTVTDAKGATSVENLFPELTVLGVGDTTAYVDSQGTSPPIGSQDNVPSAMVTLDVTGPEATKLIAWSGHLYFTLLGAGVQGSPSDKYSAAVGAGAGND
jgi:pilus assembly protein CpaB